MEKFLEVSTLLKMCRTLFLMIFLTFDGCLWYNWPQKYQIEPKKEKKKVNMESWSRKKFDSTEVYGKISRGINFTKNV